MKFILQSSLVAQLLCLGAVAQWTEPPPSTADPGTMKDCTWWFVAGASDTCGRVTATYGITQAQLVAYNPILSNSCTFITGNSYCIEQNWGAAPAPAPPSTTAPGVPTTLMTTTTTTRAATTTTTPGNGVATPTPIQPGMVSNCNKFYFVASGVTCSKVLGDENISLADFAKWNPNVGAECTGMWAEVNVCVGVIGGITPPTTPPTTTTSKPVTTTTTTTAPGNGIQTPQPTQPGMVTNCNKFHWIAQGVSCSQVLSYNGISLADFVKWNPSVGAGCSGMWAEVNVCVGVIGGAATPPTTTTKPPVTTTAPGNGVTTPQPTQPGMVTSCKKFHYVSEGDTCGQIISYNSITLANFVKWNTGVGATCQSMWAKTYVCVGV